MDALSRNDAIGESAREIAALRSQLGSVTEQFGRTLRADGEEKERLRNALAASEAQQAKADHGLVTLMAQRDAAVEAREKAVRERDEAVAARSVIAQDALDDNREDKARAEKAERERDSYRDGERGLREALEAAAEAAEHYGSHGPHPCPHCARIGFEARRALDATPTPEAKGWYCPHCRRGVPPSDVTYEETHTECGTPIGDATPSPTRAETGEVERVARIMLACDPFEVMVAWKDQTEETREGWRKWARAILSALPSRSAIRNEAFEEADRAIVAYDEAWRQHDFNGGPEPEHARLRDAIRTLEAKP